MTTSSIQAAGGDYTSIGAWESATPLDSAAEWRGQMADETFAEEVAIAGGGTTQVILEAQPGTGYNGTENSGPKVAVNPAANFYGVINLHSTNVTLEGFEITLVTQTGTIYGVRFADGDVGGLQYCKRLLVHHTSSSAFDEDFFDGHIIVENCLGYELGSGSLYATGAITDKVINCTALRTLVFATTTVTGSRYKINKNNYVAHYGQSSSHRDYLDIQAGSVTYAASDATGSSVELDNLVAAKVLIDPTAGGLNFRPVPYQSLDGAGTGNATDADIPLVDIAGNPRSSSAPTIGAFEAPVPVITLESQTDYGAVASGGISVAKPAGTVTDDGLVFIMAADGDHLWTDFEGFTAEIDQIAWTAGDRISFWSKIAGAAEPDPYTFTRGGGAENYGGTILRFSGVNTTDMIGAVSAISTGTADDAVDPIVTSPAITATDDNSVILRVYLFHGGSGASIDSFVLNNAGQEIVRSGNPELCVVSIEASPGAGNSTGTQFGEIGYNSMAYSVFTVEILPESQGAEIQIIFLGFGA